MGREVGMGMGMGKGQGNGDIRKRVAGGEEGALGAEEEGGADLREWDEWA